MQIVKRLAAPACLALLLAGCTQQVEPVNVEFRIPVEVEQVEIDNVESVVIATGTLRTVTEAELKTEIPGHFFLSRNEQGIPYAEGSVVKKDELIAEILGEDARLFIRIESTKIALENAQEELNRRKDLYAKNLISEAELKQQEQTYESALLEYDRSKLNVHKTRIESPTDGVVLRLARGANNVPITDGTYIAPGFSVATIASLDQLIADINLIGPELSRVQPGQRVRIRHYAFDDLTVNAEVLRISPELDAQTHTFRAEVIIDNDQGLLRPGMFVEVAIITEQRVQVPVLPREAVTRRSSGNVVFLVDGQRAKQQLVRLGLGDDDKVQVLDGVITGDRVVVRGLETLADGTRVRVLGDD